MNIHGGSHYPNFREFGNLFYKNWRISKARIDFSDGTSEIIWLDDVDDIQEVDFSRSVNTSYMLIVPLDYYEQYDGWDDYCISEVSPIVSL